MKIFFFSVLALMVSFTAFAHPDQGHLTFAEGKLHAHLSWIDGPNDGNESKMRLDWRDGATHAPLEPGLPFEVLLWMPSMGHGSAPTQIQQVLDSAGNVVPGAYEVTNVYFLMPGPWDVRVTLKNHDGQDETKIWQVMVGSDGHSGRHN